MTAADWLSTLRKLATELVVNRRSCWS